MKMRELKFRIYDGSKMLYNEVIERPHGEQYDETNIFYCPHITESNLAIKVLEHSDKGEDIQIINIESIMQYTGLKDKNDKEIYEGDIVEWKGERFKVSYKQDKHYIGYIATKDDTKLSYIHIWYDNIEIIGNIYENPDLLK
jgi:uncharacterized phage protein (TIGR01671 family)